ncbi:venom dipeptidyl peptidase 4 isoform X2 [Adelges cooleyi]|uniref:venom dipeptidyl peptidase 4 isoform X2 n=1 Tax=Adelges cooleyi TaxID=133065 RepID=UPI0021808F54|nr:venom dipeptidyl peptidase 4 isoform X2 [Adelges cooleyi]XP_050438093.1 venom dipeptidyl peptidase 4 isoform X2 [Adelges cooleyi]
MQSSRLDAEFAMRSSSDVFQSPTTMEKCVWNVKNRPLTFLLIVLAVAAVLGGLVYFTTDIFNKPEAQTNIETLEFLKLMNGGYEPNLFNGTWVSDAEILMKDDDGHIVLLDVRNSNKTILASNNTQNVAKCFHYELSADKEYLLIAYHYRKVYRHSFIANYDLINVKTGEQETLLAKSSNNITKARDLQLAKWSPVGQGLALVEQNNIFYISSVSDLKSEKQISFTGGFELINGIPDWVYEEEVFSTNSAMWFSKGATMLAYASFNDTQIPIMQIPLYGIPGSLKYQYPSTFAIHYPKVGTPNPNVELFVNDLQSGSSVEIRPPPDIPLDFILNTVLWSDDANLFVIWMNRIQNEAQLVHYVLDKNTVKIQYVKKFAQINGWLDFSQIPLVGKNNTLAIIYPEKQINGEFYKHVTLVKPGGQLSPLTSGLFVVSELLKWDIKSDYVYFMANTADNPEEEYMYRVLASGKGQMECMTCDKKCKFNAAVMSEDGNYYTHTCSGPNVPEVHIVKTTGEQILEWNGNNDLKEELKPVILPRISFIDVPINDNYTARVKLILPPMLDENADKKYPMLVNTYAGPGSNMAVNKFSLDWNKYFCTSQNVIIAQIDGRGSGRKSNKYLFANYKKLGTYEIEDQIAVAKSLQSRFSFIDASKSAIWGWSYGGYAAGMALAKDDKNIFKCALSVAPVTDWIYYDTIYTERYMGLITENGQGYRNGSLLTHVEKMRDKKYMLIHGTFDDNVHYQQSMMLSAELEHKVILFRQQSYPDESHGLSSVRPHVYRTIGSFFMDCFKGNM